jgi:PAS domain S-box-containing protein
MDQTIDELELLRQSERLMNETPFMITRCSRDLRYVFVSRAYAEMLGREPDELKGRRIVEIMGEEGFATIRPYVDLVLTGAEVEYENVVTFAGVGPRNLHVVYKPDLDSTGRTVGWIASIMDVTDRKGARDARTLLASIVDSSMDAIITKDLNGIVTSWNGAAERLFGYTAEEMFGKPIRLLIPPERQAEEDDILARLRNGQRIEHFETIRISKDGRRLLISLSISPIRDATGTIVGASKIARDITEARNAEAERLRLLEENAAVTEALNNVGSVVASDLDRDKVVQAVTDTATELTTAQFGAFFYNVKNDAGEAYMLYTISGAPPERSRSCRCRATPKSSRRRSTVQVWSGAPISRRTLVTATIRLTTACRAGTCRFGATSPCPSGGAPQKSSAGCSLATPTSIGSATITSGSRWASAPGPPSRSRTLACSAWSKKPVGSKTSSSRACRTSYGRLSTPCSATRGCFAPAC